MSEAAPVKQPCPLIMWSCKCCLSSSLAGLNLAVLLVQINGNSLWQAVSFQWNHNMDLVPPLPCSPFLPTPTEVWLPTSGYHPWLSPPTPSNWCVRACCGWSDGLYPVLCWNTVGRRVKQKAAFPGGSGHGCHHPPPCAAKGLLTVCSSKQERPVGNALKSKLANTHGVLTCYYCAFTLWGFY